MHSANSALACTWALCALIFFDDYSSILIVGNSLRPALPALRVAPERFALIVHIMGVLLASLSPISSWVGLQIGYVSSVFKQLGRTDEPFVATMATIPYRFFPLLLLALLPLLLLSNRHIGPMADLPPLPPPQPSSSSSNGQAGGSGDALGALEPKPGTALRPINALLPFGTIVVVTFAGMLLDGAAKVAAAADGPPLTLLSALSAADSINALVWASAAGWLVTLALVLSQRLLTLSEAMEAWMEGMKDVLEPTFVLLLAWALGAVIEHVGTATFLAQSLHSGLPRWALPPLVSLLAHAISYACGSSFGTMGIILPLVGPLAHSLGGGETDYLLHCIASVLGGATFGNLCSPISDTTILTVLATRCDLQAHVNTITPYTSLIAALALALGNIPVALGLYGPLTALALGTLAIGGLLAVFGK